MLTGESTPVIKNHIPMVNKIFNYKADKKYVLFCGTKLIQKRAMGGGKVLALAITTSFNTEKGNMIRSILFPKPTEQKFQKDSIKYILVMGIVSIIGFFSTLPFLLREDDVTIVSLIKRALDLITTTVPPALPACLGIGISYAISRMKEKGISCINREKVNIAGKINLICFDKTGTLTEDFLDLYGFRITKFKNNAFTFDNTLLESLDHLEEITSDYYIEKNLNRENINWKLNKVKDMNTYFIECLATCHSLTQVNGELMGDPIDKKMFDASKWQLRENLENSENYDSLITTFVRPKKEKELKEKLTREDIDEEQIMKTHYEIGIVRRFDFSSKLCRMSVLVKNVNEPYFKVYCKGSPEKIKELCRPDTIPANFSSVLAKYTMKGYRVLGLSMKMVKLDYLSSQKVERDKLECNMIFLGLMIVQNKLKSQTKPSIDLLHEARLKMVMATGDNILTAISVAKDCMLVKPESTIFMIELQNEAGELKLVSNKVETFSEEEEKQETIYRTTHHGKTLLN
jgi:cation-transporting P-type ATPase 13A2